MDRLNETVIAKQRSKQGRSNLSILFISLCTFFFSNLAFAADPASANYQIGESYFPAAAGNAQSTNYKADEGSVDYFSKTTAASANYSFETEVGVSGAEKIPVINSVSPSGNAKFFSDESAAYTITAVSPDSDTLQYRAKQDGTTKAGPQTSSALSWSLGSSDLGRRAVKLEVIDPDGTVLKQQPAYIYRRPVK